MGELAAARVPSIIPNEAANQISLDRNVTEVDVMSTQLR